MDRKQNNQENKDQFFHSLSTLRQSVSDGTYKEILDDWKWIFSYSKRYKGAIIFYTLLGIFSTSMGMVVIMFKDE